MGVASSKCRLSVVERAMKKKQRVQANWFDSLESRALFAVAATASLSPVSAESGQYPTQLNLANYFHSTTISGTTVALNVTVGDTTGTVDLELYDSATPITVANFLKYVDSGRYDDSFFHRSVSDFILQGGGYTYPGTAISTFGTITNEFASSPRNDSGEVNFRGTVAMAKVDGDPNSADSQFFINMADNASSLDSSNGGFTTFGRVLGDGMTFADTLNNLPTVSLASPFEDLPVSSSYDSSTGSPTSDDLVLITTAQRVAPITYAVSTSNVDVVNPVVDANGVLTLNYQPQATGTATITIVATDLDGASLTQTFDVTVGAAASLKATYGSQVVNPDGSTKVDFGNISTAINGVVTRTLTLENTGDVDITNLSYALPDGFSLGTGAPTSLAIGEHKDVTVTIDTSRITNSAGNLVITSTSDDAGQGAKTETTTIPLAADLQLPVTAGQNGIKAVTFTQANGTVATFTLTGPGTATFDFDGDNVTTTDNGKGTMVVSSTGGATLFNITFANTTISTKVKLASKGTGPVIVEAVSGAGSSSLGTFDAKTAKLTGEFIFGSSIAQSIVVKQIILGSADGATFDLGLNNDTTATVSLTIGTAVNTTFFAGYTVAALTANSWSKGTGTGEIQATNIGKLTVKGDFDSAVTTSGNIVQATVGGAVTGQWSVGGAVGKLTAASAPTSYKLTATGAVGSVAFKGEYDGTITGVGVNTFSAAASNGGAVSASRYLNSVAFKGVVTDGYFNAGYHIGKFSAVEIDSTRIYGGVSLQSGQVLPLATTDFVADATLDGVLYTSSIGSITLTGKGTTYAFSNSVVAAKAIGTVKAGIVATGSGTPTQVTTGIAADTIGSIALVTDVGQHYAAKNVNAQTDVTSLLNNDGQTAGTQVVIY